LLTFNN